MRGHEIRITGARGRQPYGRTGSDVTDPNEYLLVLAERVKENSLDPDVAT